MMPNNFDNEMLRDIGTDIVKNPEKYMISPDGRLFAKCGNCDAWHGIHEVKLSYN